MASTFDVWRVHYATYEELRALGLGPEGIKPKRVATQLSLERAQELAASLDAQADPGFLHCVKEHS